MRKTIQNDERKEPFVPLPGNRLLANDERGTLKRKVALEAIPEEMTMAELAKKYGVHLLPDDRAALAIPEI